MSAKKIFQFAIALPILVMSCFALQACWGVDPLIYQDFVLEEGKWEATDEKEFVFEMKDTLQRRQMYVHLRNDETYKYSNLFLFVELEFPNGKKRIDTLECPLADATGRWYGKSFGSMIDHKVRYGSEPVLFPTGGEYKVKLVHAMREEELEGVFNVGFSIE